MFSTLARIALSTALVLSASACNSDSSAPAGAKTGASDGPDKALMTSVELAKRSDIAGLLQHTLPPTDFERIKTEWQNQSAEEPVTDEDRQKFAEMMGKLTAADAENALFAEYEADLKQFDAQYQQQMPMMIAMGRGYVQAAIAQSSDLSANEKEHANNAINALAGWVESTRFTDPELVKKAIAVVCRTARELDLHTLDEVRGLSFDQSAPKLQIAVNGLKQVFDVYGFSINDTLASVKAETLSNDGNTAQVKTSYTLLGTPLQTTTEMLKIDQRWYSKSTIQQLKEAEAKARQADATDATDAEDAEDAEDAG